MAGPTAPPRPDPTGDPGGTDAEEARSARRPGLVAAAIVVVAMLGMWGFVFAYHLSGQWRDDTPGHLSDPAYGQQAEQVCAAALTRIDQLPPAFEAGSAAERADVIDRSNEILGDMVDDLTELAPVAGDESPIVDEWLSDWRTYVGDRADFAQRLRDDPGARFYVTQSDRDNRQITQAVDRFATINEMPSCMALNDLA